MAQDKNSIFLTEMGERVFTDPANSVPGSEHFYLSCFSKSTEFTFKFESIKKKKKLEIQIWWCTWKMQQALKFHLVFELLSVSGTKMPNYEMLAVLPFA